MTTQLADTVPSRAEYITAQIAETLSVSPEMVLPFVDFTDCLAELFHHAQPVNSRFLVAGHATPEVALAAHRAKADLKEILGSSPFCADSDAVIREIISEYDVIYLANPSRITGANYALADLESLARAVPQGRLILDEYYFDFYGITGLALINQYPNIVVMRSFTAAYGVSSSDAGYCVAAPETIAHLKRVLAPEAVSMTLYKLMTTVMSTNADLSRRLVTLHDESLRIATRLTRLGVQCRLTATDFLLMRVASPTEVGNYLAQYRAPIENLSGYPEMENYIRYKIQSEFSNDFLLKGFEKIPSQHYKMSTPDRRAVRLRHAGDTTISSKLAGVPSKIRHRATSLAKS